MSSRTRIKICGITRLADALHAVALGADALGFIFAPRSPRRVAPEAARAIVAALPPFVTPVAVVVNETPEAVRALLEATGCRVAQLHGDESPEYLRELGVPAIKALPIWTPDDLAPAARYPAARAILLDTRVDGAFGGTGRPFDWSIARAICADSRPIILAGGLTVENVAEAVRVAEPYAVDVSSGIEVSPGVKDPARMAAFIAAVRATAA